MAQMQSGTSGKSIQYHTVKIDGLDIFYREAGPEGAPTILLLHGILICSAISFQCWRKTIM
jgi:pimeloyl-ACP methyl ester carboxylesterase